MKLLTHDAIKQQPLASMNRVLHLESIGLAPGKKFALAKVADDGSKAFKATVAAYQEVNALDEAMAERNKSAQYGGIDHSEVLQYRKDNAARVAEQLRNARDIVNTSRTATQLQRDAILNPPALAANDTVVAIKENELRIAAKSWNAEQRARIMRAADPATVLALARGPDPLDPVALSAQGI